MRSFPSLKLVVSSARVDGAAIAAPTPCAARAARSHALDWASPRDAEHEHPPPAEDVARTCAEQQEPAEGERVRVLHPREAGGGEAERVVDPGQRRDHDRGVEDDHQVAGDDHGEDRGGAGRAAEDVFG